jgi:hypothetical protein
MVHRQFAPASLGQADPDARMGPLSVAVARKAYKHYAGDPRYRNTAR